jgi:hypothetical protein
MDIQKTRWGIHGLPHLVKTEVLTARTQGYPSAPIPADNLRTDVRFPFSIWGDDYDHKIHLDLTIPTNMFRLDHPQGFIRLVAADGKHLTDVPSFKDIIDAYNFIYSFNRRSADADGIQINLGVDIFVDKRLSPDQIFNSLSDLALEDPEWQMDVTPDTIAKEFSSGEKRCTLEISPDPHLVTHNDRTCRYIRLRGVDPHYQIYPAELMKIEKGLIALEKAL